MTANGPATPITAAIQSTTDFEQEVLPHLETLARVARRMSHHHQAAEDLVQDTLERAYCHFGRYQPGTNIRAWLLRIMSNLHVSNCRREATLPPIASVSITDDVLPAHQATWADPRDSDVEACTMDRLAEEAILATIDALPLRLQVVVRLVCVHGLPTQGVADTLGIPRGTVGSRLHRARSRLRHALKDRAAPELPVMGAA
jgi:RNA polymerase sigma-70 factor (ECF subfamily)